MTVLVLNGASCRRLAREIRKLPIDDNGSPLASIPARDFAAIEEIAAALAECPNGARVRIDLQPIESDPAAN